MDFNRTYPFHCTKMSPGLEGWKQECRSSSNKGLMQLNRNKSRGTDLTSGLREELTEKRESAQGQGTSTDPSKLKHFKKKLVEYLVELLKPSWKEGWIRKEDHNNIIKNSADKVIDSFRASRIPRSDEQIKEYLRLSRPRLDKLLQELGNNYTHIQHISLVASIIFTCSLVTGEEDVSCKNYRTYDVYV